MSKEAKEASGQTKRPYERPRLEPIDIFGAEASYGSCCRSYGTCSYTARNTKRTTTDANKATTSTSS
jgi:hypothetical protein